MPKKFRVEITRTAEQDITEIFEYISHDSPARAGRFILALESHTKTLESFPQRCPLIPEAKHFALTYRHLIHGDYRIIFRIENSTVYILRMFHSSRLLDL
jgi:plasmid stabilization system protein ParE